MSNDFSFFFPLFLFTFLVFESLFFWFGLVIRVVVLYARPFNSHVFCYSRECVQNQELIVLAGCCRTSLLIYICLFWLFRSLWSFFGLWTAFFFLTHSFLSNIITLKLILVYVSMRSAYIEPLYEQKMMTVMSYLY